MVLFIPMKHSVYVICDIVLHIDKKIQVEEMQKIISKEKFIGSIQKIVHSPLIRAKDTCYGIFDLSSRGDESPPIPVSSLDCLREVTPYESLVKRRRPLMDRIVTLHEWLDSQDEERIAIVGHSEYFMVMLGLTEKFKNCDVWKVNYSKGQWTNLELLYRLGC